MQGVCFLRWNSWVCLICFLGGSVYNSIESVLKFPVTFYTRKHLRKKKSSFLNHISCTTYPFCELLKKIKMLCSLPSDLRGLSCWMIPRTRYPASQILHCIVTDMGEENRPLSSSHACLMILVSI